MMFLRSKNELGFIDEMIMNSNKKDGKTLAEINTQEIVNSMIQPYIINLINPKLHKSVAYVDFTQKLWENIQKRYAVPKIPKIDKLKVEIALCKQDKEAVVQFFPRCRGLWSELDNYIKVLACTFWVGDKDSQDN